jgi:threonine/homoserine efflux transporter RhtA
LLVGVAATLLQQSAFHAGSLRASVPAMLVLEPIVAVLLGQVILGEHLTVSTPTAVVLGMALAAMAAATITLGRDEGAYEEELEAGRKTQAARRSTR